MDEQWQNWWTSRGAAPAEESSTAGVPSCGNPHAEYSWGQTESVLFDLSESLVWLEASGKDRAKFLHNFCTQDIRGLVPGRGAEAFITTVQGKVLAHSHIWAGQQTHFLSATQGRIAPLLMHFDKYRITEDVEFTDRSGEFGTLFVSGPEAADRLLAIGVPASSLGDLSHCYVAADAPAEGVAAATVRPSDLRLARVNWLGQPGFLLLVPRSARSAWGDLLVAGGIHPAGSQAFDALRIEACYPWFGRDITEDNLAQEVRRTPRAISFTKGCYLGQETVARIDALGHVNQQLCGIRFQSGSPPGPQSPVFTEAGTDKAAGRITSATLSFSEDVPVALAYMRRGHDRNGTRVFVSDGATVIPGEVYWGEGA